MSKTVTLRLDDEVYRKFHALASDDNRSLSNFIQTAALRFVEACELADDFEMAEIKSNAAVNRSIKKGLGDARAGRGRFV